MHCDEKNSLNFIRKSYLFRNLPETTLNALVSISKCKFYESGQTIFDQGSEANSLYIIGYGTVSLEMNAHEDYQSHPVLLGSGETFGEAHFHLREKRIGAAKAREYSEIYEISYNSLSRVLEADPASEIIFTRALALHLGRYCHHLMEGMMDHKVRIFLNEGISSFI